MTEPRYIFFAVLSAAGCAQRLNRAVLPVAGGRSLAAKLFVSRCPSLSPPGGDGRRVLGRACISQRRGSRNASITTQRR